MKKISQSTTLCLSLGAYIQKELFIIIYYPEVILLQKNKQMKMFLLTKGEEPIGHQIVLMLLTLKALIMSPKGFSWRYIPEEQNRCIYTLLIHEEILGFTCLVTGLLYPFDWSAIDIERNLLVISVNDGRVSGSGDQQCSIRFLQSGSQCPGIGGRRLFFTIPPSRTNTKL